MKNIHIHTEKKQTRYQGVIEVKMDGGILVLGFQDLCPKVQESDEKSIEVPITVANINKIDRKIMVLEETSKMLGIHDR